MGNDLNRHPQEEKTSNEAEKQKAEPIEEQKKYVAKKESYLNDIKELEEKNAVLEKEAETIEELISTFCIDSIAGLENLIKTAIKNYTDLNDIKEVKSEIKRFETIVAFEELLNEYKTLANEHRANITANNNDITNYKNRLEEIEGKINCFQTKLDIGDSESLQGAETSA